jgi:hypothetical protein
MWLLGLTFRTLFIVVLIVVTMRVAGPQNETIWSSYETPGDLLRLVLGFAVCVWLVFNIFRLPKDAGGYRIWLYIGPVLVPLALLCAFVIW